MSGAGDVGGYLIKLVKDKTIAKPPPAPTPEEVEGAATNETGESTKALDTEKSKAEDKPTISEKDNAAPTESDAGAGVPSK